MENKEIFDDLGRPEYLRGELPLDFRFDFSDGSALLASQDERGIAKVRIEKGGEILVDFDDFLAPGYQYVTPTYINRRSEFWGEFLTSGEWEIDPIHKKVSIGDWVTAEGLLDVLHEAGHTHQNEDPLKQILREIEQRSKEDPSFDSSNERKKLLIEEAKYQGEIERGAWAYALQALRKIKEQTGIDIITEIFGTRQKAQEYIRIWLRNHKESLAHFPDDADFTKYLNNLFEK